MATNVIRVTKAQKFEVIKAALREDATHTFPGNEERAAYVFDHAEMVAFIDEQLDLLAKKNSGDKKLTKDQEKNQEVMELICNYLGNLPADKEGATCTQIAKDVLTSACPDEATPQKASALCRLLKQAARVDSKDVKGKTVFYLL